MQKINLIFLLLLAFPAWAKNELRDVKFTSCRPGACTTIKTDAFYRSNLQPGLMVFGAAHVNFVNPETNKSAMNFDVQDGYYNSEDQVLVLRGIKNSAHHEMIYNLTTGKLINI